MFPLTQTRWSLLAQVEGATVLTLLSVCDNGKSILVAGTPSGVAIAEPPSFGWRWLGTTVPLLVETLAYVPTQDGSCLWFAGTPHGLFRLRGEHQPWEPVLVGSRVTALAVAEDGEQPAIFIGTERDGIFCSDDGGTTWKSRNVGLPDLSVLALALSPTFAYDRLGFVATESGLFGTRNGGASWRPLHFPVADPVITSIVVSPRFAEDRRLFVSVDNYGVFTSDDAGEHWRRLPLEQAEGVTAVAVNAHGQHLAVAVDQHVLWSPDGGRKWHDLGSLPSPVLSLSFASFAPNATDEQLLAGCLRSGVWSWNPSTHEWRPWPVPLMAAVPSGLAAVVEHKHQIRVVTAWLEHGVLCGDLPQGVWSTQLNGVSRLFFHLIHVRSTSRLYLQASDGLWRSGDGGITWDLLTPSLAPARLLAVTANARADGDVIFAAMRDGTWWYSTDGGKDWQTGQFGEGNIVRAIAVTRRDSGQIVLLALTSTFDAQGQLDITLRASVDGGRSWLAWLRQPDPPTSHLALSDDLTQWEEIWVGLDDTLWRGRWDTGGSEPVWSALPSLTPSPLTAVARPPTAFPWCRLLLAAGPAVFIVRGEDDALTAWSEGLEDAPILGLALAHNLSGLLAFAVDAYGRVWGRLLVPEHAGS
ncbi:WD40/YVTN/BNR-like repeat-containing protein [Thermorudis peleae]|uniref:WD40/YVTN/BNR-like repeat-containing protein n=1 Tax=Thermorudis peleae TaxID=1382356 RepID=UPI0005712BCA|nr:sialidase family protein [Thermorudis peleae]